MPHISPITLPDKAKLSVEVHKPHAGLLEVRAVTPSGDYFRLVGYRFHSRVKIAANKTAGVPDPPADWYVDEMGTVTVTPSLTKATRVKVPHPLGQVPMEVEVEHGKAEAPTDADFEIVVPKRGSDEPVGAREIHWRVRGVV